MHDWLAVTPSGSRIVAVRRVLAALMMLTFTASAVITATMCGGWESTASARMDCCAAMGHDCPDQEAADGCCGRAEQAQQKFENSTDPYKPLPPAAVLLAIPPATGLPALTAAVAFERSFQQHPHSPPLSQSSVLLI
jgi:hypothetical protein